MGEGTNVIIKCHIFQVSVKTGPSTYCRDSGDDVVEGQGHATFHCFDNFLDSYHIGISQEAVPALVLQWSVGLCRVFATILHHLADQILINLSDDGSSTG